jgi:hypothetical protein
MPVDIRPPPGSALLRYPDSFDPEMEFHLRERNTTTLKEMQKSAISVESNLLIKRSKLETLCSSPLVSWIGKQSFHVFNSLHSQR